MDRSMLDVKVENAFFIKVKFANEDLLDSPHSTPPYGGCTLKTRI